MNDYEQDERICMACSVAGCNCDAVITGCEDDRTEEKTMRTYTQVDFEVNSKKYELFRTAIARQYLFTDNAEGDVIEPGTVVAIEYRRTAVNYLYERNEPVYEIKGYDMEVRGSHLQDFLL